MKSCDDERAFSVTLVKLLRWTRIRFAPSILLAAKYAVSAQSRAPQSLTQIEDASSRRDYVCLSRSRSSLAASWEPPSGLLPP